MFPACFQLPQNLKRPSVGRILPTNCHLAAVRSLSTHTDILNPLHPATSMAYFFLDQLLCPSDSGSDSQRGPKRCGGGGADWCDRKRGMRRAHWEAHFGAHGHGPHGPPHGGPHGPPHGHGPHGGRGPWGHHHHHGGRHWGVPADRGLPIDFLEVRLRLRPPAMLS